MIYEAENPLEIPLPFTIKYGESLGGDHFRVKCLQVGGWTCGHILDLFARTNPREPDILQHYVCREWPVLITWNACICWF